MSESLESKLLEIALSNCRTEGSLEIIKKQLDLAWEHANKCVVLRNERQLLHIENMKSEMSPDQIKRVSVFNPHFDQSVKSKILNGGMPSVTGITFTDLEFKEIQEAVESKKTELDNYIKFVIKPKCLNVDKIV